MIPEELLRPRYKVIATWPEMDNQNYHQGQIIGLNLIDEATGNKQWFIRRGNGSYYDAFYDMYPHLFKKLDWWEERKQEDMPEYLNCPSRKMLFRVESWHKSYFIIDGRQKMQYRNYIPATREEYEAYIEKQ